MSLLQTHTPYPKLNDVLQQLVDGIHEILQANLTGVYLQGSFAVGDFDEHSDVDFIVVMEQALTAEQVQALQALHGRLYELKPHWAQHLEGSYFPKEILRRPPRPEDKLWYLDNGSRELIQADHCNTIVVRWTLGKHGVVLSGPPPESLIDAIDVTVLQQAIFDDLNQWGQEILDDPERYNNRFYQGFIVLNYCRMLHDLIHGTTSSKRAGAEWAKAKLDPAWRDLIDRSWNGRPDPARSVRQPADPGDYARTLDFVRYIMDESQQYVPGRQTE